MELNLQTIKNTDFQPKGSWNNRFYYSKNGFEIVEHFGFYRCNKNNLSGYGKQIKTVEELNTLYEQWIKKKVQKLKAQLAKFEEYL